jgi:N-acyl-D-aspartate/D-glutamate deacylase
MSTFDITIVGGTVFDGLGNPGRQADVAIRDGRIVEVAATGQLVGSSKRVVNAHGKIVTPGFVDMHTHYDAQATWDGWLTPSSWHGCTTVVMGNCGVGFAPARPDKHAWLIDLMEGVEDIPGSAMVEGIKWGWETFPQFLDVLDKMPRVLDVAAQVPHCALRAYVMGERANEADATEAEVAAMARLVAEGLRAGAVGFSTSRTSIHKTKSGELVPGTIAAADELYAIGKAMREVGHGVFQHATEHGDVPKSFVWMKELARRTGLRIVFSLSQTDWAADTWRENLRLLDECAAEGLDIWGQAAGRGVGILMGFELTAHPFAGHPTFQKVFAQAAGDRAALFAALAQPSVRSQIISEAPLPLDPFSTFITRTFAKMFPQRGEAMDYEPPAEASIAAIAQRSGRPPLEVAYDALLANDGMLYFPLFNYAHGDLGVVQQLQTHPRVQMGLSDAGAHCGAICDGGMPTFMLTHWARDRQRGDRLPLEYIIRRQTRDTAAFYGFTDRGVIAPGYRADINVIDYDRLAFLAPQVAYDLPAGGRRLVQRARGYDLTMLAGIPISEHGEFTGALPGKLLRGPQTLK